MRKSTRRTKEQILEQYLNKKIFRLTAIRLLDKSECNKQGYWFEWLCECGKKRILPIGTIESGHTKSCGCLNKEAASNRHRICLLGQRFGKLLVTEYAYVKKSRIFWKCKCDCGEICYVPATNLRKLRGTKSCGCNVFRKGADHPNWDESIPLEDKLNRRGIVKNPLYEEWVKKVFTRDNYKCVITGTRLDLNAHHLYSWNSNTHLRYEIENGVTLTKIVHKLFHKLYGTGNNTKEQFEDFVIRYKTDNLGESYGKIQFLNLLSEKNWELISEYNGHINYVTLKCQHGKEFSRLVGNINKKSKCKCEKINKTGFAGIYKIKSGWRTVAYFQNTEKYLGIYPSLEEALFARNSYLNSVKNNKESSCSSGACSL